MALILCRVVPVKWQSLLNETDAAAAAAAAAAVAAAAAAATATILLRSLLITTVVYAARLGTVVASRSSRVKTSNWLVMAVTLFSSPLLFLMGKCNQNSIHGTVVTLASVASLNQTNWHIETSWDGSNCKWALRILILAALINFAARRYSMFEDFIASDGRQLEKLPSDIENCVRGLLSELCRGGWVLCLNVPVDELEVLFGNQKIKTQTRGMQFEFQNKPPTFDLLWLVFDVDFQVRCLWWWFIIITNESQWINDWCSVTRRSTVQLRR